MYIKTAWKNYIRQVYPHIEHENYYNINNNILTILYAIKKIKAFI